MESETQSTQLLCRHRLAAMAADAQHRPETREALRVAQNTSYKSRRELPQANPRIARKMHYVALCGIAGPLPAQS